MNKEERKICDIVMGYVDRRFKLPINEGDVIREIGHILGDIEELAERIEKGEFSPSDEDMKSVRGDEKYHAQF